MRLASGSQLASDLACGLKYYEAYQQAVPDDAETEKWLADLNARAKR